MLPAYRYTIPVEKKYVRGPSWCGSEARCSQPDVSGGKTKSSRVSPRDHLPAGFVMHHCGDDNSDVEELVGVEGDIELAWPKAFRDLHRVHGGA